MGLYVPSSSDWRFFTSNVIGTRPAAAYGTTITPGNNTMGSYTEVISDSLVTTDIYRIGICVNSNNVSAAARDTLLTIGKDESGGTSYTDWITNLMVSSAGPYNVGSSGVWYFFPLFIPAGTALAAKASVNNATVGTLRCIINLYGAPTKPESVRVGSVFRSFGETTASSRGTTVTPGTTGEGAWTQLGSAVDTPLWWWQYGYGANDTTMGGNVIHADVAAGDASNKKILVQDAPITTTTNEQVYNAPLTEGCVANVAEGDLIYGRLQTSGTADSNVSMMAYGVG